MKLRSLALQSDVMIRRFNSEVADKGDYIVIKSPSNPGFHWGNYLIFPNPPRKGDHKKWTELYRREFTYYPEIRHMTFAWDLPERGEPEEFVEAGFKFDDSITLEATCTVMPPKFNSDVLIRPIESDQEWENLIQLQTLCRDGEFEPVQYELFKRRQMANYRDMHAAGRGSWFGAFLGDKLVGDLGIFHEDGIARYQNVETHPDHRRQGICGTLVYQTSRIAFDRFQARRLVMVADTGYHAARIYESVGFKPVERTYSLGWWID